MPDYCSRALASDTFEMAFFFLICFVFAKMVNFIRLKDPGQAGRAVFFGSPVHVEYMYRINVDSPSVQLLFSF